MNLQFLEWKCRTVWGAYPNGQTALVLVDAEDGQTIAKASVALPHAPHGPDEIFIKDWSENEGMVQALIDANIVRRVIKLVPTARVSAHHCQLTADAYKEAVAQFLET